MRRDTIDPGGGEQLRARADATVAAIGLSIWVVIMVTSTRTEGWNDPRYVPATIGASFILGLLRTASPRRIGMLLGTAGPGLGIGQSLLRVRDLSVLPAAPVIFLLFGVLCLLSAAAGIIARTALRWLGRAFPHRASTSVRPRIARLGRSKRPRSATSVKRIAAGTASHSGRSAHQRAVLSRACPKPCGNSRRMATA